MRIYSTDIIVSRQCRIVWPQPCVDEMRNFATFVITFHSSKIPLSILASGMLLYEMFTYNYQLSSLRF